MVGILGAGQLAVTFPGAARLKELVAAGRGVISMTAHVGCWQVAMAALGELETPVNLLIRREAGDVDRLIFEHRGGENPFGSSTRKGSSGGRWRWSPRSSAARSCR